MNAKPPTTTGPRHLRLAIPPPAPTTESPFTRRLRRILDSGADPCAYSPDGKHDAGVDVEARFVLAADADSRRIVDSTFHCMGHAFTPVSLAAVAWDDASEEVST